MKHPDHTFTEQEVLTILRNMGHDVECGACMAIAFTGVGLPGDKHTCENRKDETARVLITVRPMIELFKRYVAEEDSTLFCSCGAHFTWTGVDPGLSAWMKAHEPHVEPLCGTCGKSAREGKHATDLGEGHDFVPSTGASKERE